MVRKCRKINGPIGLDVLCRENLTVYVFSDEHDLKKTCSWSMFQKNCDFVDWVKELNETNNVWYGLEMWMRKQKGRTISKHEYKRTLAHFKKTGIPLDVIRYQSSSLPYMKPLDIRFNLLRNDVLFRRVRNHLIRKSGVESDHLHQALQELTLEDYRSMLCKILVGKLTWFPMLTNVYRQLQSYQRIALLSYVKTFDWATDIQNGVEDDHEALAYYMCHVVDLYIFVVMILDFAKNLNTGGESKIYVLYLGYNHSYVVVKMLLDLGRFIFRFGVKNRKRQCITLPKDL